MNQIEIWLSILVRKLLTRGSFKSVEDLQAKVLAFIGYSSEAYVGSLAVAYLDRLLTQHRGARLTHRNFIFPKTS